MRRVVVTGVGVVSAIGNDKAEVVRSLKECCSGIQFIPEMREMGFRCQVAGRVKGLDTSHVGKRPLLSISDVAKYAAVATLEALEDAQLPLEALPTFKLGVVVGGSFGGINEVWRVHQSVAKHKSLARVGATGLVKIMHSTASGNLASWLKVQGRAYSLCSSSCSGVDNIGHA